MFLISLKAKYTFDFRNCLSVLINVDVENKKLASEKKLFQKMFDFLEISQKIKSEERPPGWIIHNRNTQCEKHYKTQMQILGP